MSETTDPRELERLRARVADLEREEDEQCQWELEQAQRVDNQLALANGVQANDVIMAALDELLELRARAPPAAPVEGGAGEVERDYEYLCGECGSITPADSWAALIHDDDGNEVPAPIGWSDPHLRCPVCREVQADDDNGPGVWAGTREAMEAERAGLLADDEAPYAEWWADRLRLPAPPAPVEGDGAPRARRC